MSRVQSHQIRMCKKAGNLVETSIEAFPIVELFQLSVPSQVCWCIKSLGITMVQTNQVRGILPPIISITPPSSHCPMGYHELVEDKVKNTLSNGVGQRLVGIIGPTKRHRRNLTAANILSPCVLPNLVI